MTDVTLIPNKWLVRVDNMNHQLVKYDAGGRVIVNGKFKGQLTQAGWKPIESYHPSMQQAIRRVITLEAGSAYDATLEGYLELQLSTAHKITNMIKESL